MNTKIAHFIGIASIVGLVITCFLPWVSFPYIQETFTGFDVRRFDTGNYYGRAGYPITVLCTIILLLMLLPRLWAKRVNMFIAAMLFAYCIRTFVIFTSGVIAGDVVKHAGIYMVLILSFIILVCSLFPWGVDEKVESKK